MKQKNPSLKKKSIKRKVKVIIAKPTKSSTIVFARRTSKSRKKLKQSEEDAEKIIFKKPPPTHQEKLKELEGGVGMIFFKSLRYETRNEDEKKKIENMMMTKLGKWKYSNDRRVQEIPNKL